MSSRVLHRPVTIVLLLAGTLCGCAPLQPAPRLAPLERYLPYAGEPIPSFVAFRVDSWEVLSDEKLVLWTGPNEAHLLTVQTPCSHLEFTEGLRVTTTASTVSHFEYIEFRDRPSRTLNRCPILEIRRLDIRRYKDDLKRHRARPAPSPASAPASMPVPTRLA